MFALLMCALHTPSNVLLILLNCILYARVYTLVYAQLGLQDMNISIFPHGHNVYYDPAFSLHLEFG